MIVVNDQHCPKNHRCPAVSCCPQGAIIQDTATSAPRIEYELCTECGSCALVCRTFEVRPVAAVV